MLEKWPLTEAFVNCVFDFTYFKMAITICYVETF